VPGFFALLTTLHISYKNNKPHHPPPPYIHDSKVDTYPESRNVKSNGRIIYKSLLGFSVKIVITHPSKVQKGEVLELGYISLSGSVVLIGCCILSAGFAT